jgi:hypothetical protein
MLMAANGILQWRGGERGAATARQAESEFPAASLMPSQLVAEALFAELGLDRFLVPAATPGERLMGDILLFAAGVISGDADASAAPETAIAEALSEEAVAECTIPPLPAAEDQAGPAANMQPAVEDEGDRSAMGPTLAGESAEIAEASGEMPAAGEPGWLALDMSEPREWSAVDIAMLIYRDSAEAAGSLASRAGWAAAQGEDDLAAETGRRAFPDESLDEFFAGDRFAA